MSQHNDIGQQGENLAAKFLSQQGFEIIDRNFHSRYGEIDLIAVQKNLLLFIEVRSRGQSSYVTGKESITHAKQKKILKTAEYYLLQHPHTGDCRIDVISIDHQYSPSKIEWIKNAISY